MTLLTIEQKGPTRAHTAVSPPTTQPDTPPGNTTDATPTNTGADPTAAGAEATAARTAATSTDAATNATTDGIEATSLDADAPPAAATTDATAAGAAVGAAEASAVIGTGATVSAVNTDTAVNAVDAVDAVGGELSRLLFDQHERERIHTPWRTLIAGPDFQARAGLSPAERTALSYQRLHHVNDHLDSAEALAADPRRLAALTEWTAVVDSGLGTLSAIHYNLFLGSLLDHDSHHRDLSAFSALQYTGTFLCTELDHGNDAAALETTATHNPATGGFILNTPTPGARKFMPNTSPAGGPKTALVAARLLIDGNDEGVFLFLTPLSDHHGTLPGIHVQPLPERGGAPVDHCLTTFDHVPLPRTALLEADHGRLGTDATLHSTVTNRRRRFLSSIHRVTTGKLCMSGAAIGVSRTALTIAVRYAHTRHIAGPKTGQRIPLTAHRSHTGRLLTALATTYAMTFLHRHTLNQWTQHTQPERTAEACSRPTGQTEAGHANQAEGTERAEETCTERTGTERVEAGQADTERGEGADIGRPGRAEVERLVALTKGWTTWQARDIVTECRERCGARGLFTANRLTEIMTDLEGTITAEGDNLVIWLKAASEMIFQYEAGLPRTPTPPPAERHLTDCYFLRDLLAHTEAIWQTRARTALRNGPTKDPIGRWNATSAPALNMVSAHATLQAADAFLTAMEQTADPAARDLLELLCRLFLLNQLTPHTGDLLAHQHLTPHHIHTLHTLTDTTLHQLTPHLTTLTDAFDLPEQVLATIPLLHDTPDTPTHNPPAHNPSTDTPPTGNRRLLTTTLPHPPTHPAHHQLTLATP
ncbi:acyl-CoA dehydrogenase [Streptomyces sp. NPDC059582]|uniref:acyl-CoA dehydrogenase family protein n=1 Tax=Streptomyces sp. NPDC059582 TaxID=3346875 RepID=UPI0036843FD0